MFLKFSLKTPQRVITQCPSGSNATCSVRSVSDALRPEATPAAVDLRGRGTRINPALSPASPAQSLLRSIENGTDLDADALADSDTLAAPTVTLSRPEELEQASATATTPPAPTCACKGQCATRACPCRKRKAFCTDCCCGSKKTCKNKVNKKPDRSN